MIESPEKYTQIYENRNNKLILKTVRVIKEWTIKNKYGLIDKFTLTES